MLTTTANPVVTKIPPALLAQVVTQCARPFLPELAPLVEAMQQRFHGSLAAVVLYGSCLRGVPAAEGVVDLMAVVTDYRSAYAGYLPRLFNRLLPPNVYYSELAGTGAKLRVKYAVISLQDLTTGVTRWFHPYLWARCAQPVRLLYAAHDAARATVHEALAHAVLTFLENTAPILEPGESSVESIWLAGLSLTYAAELRPEREEQAAALVRHNLNDFTMLTQCALPALEQVLVQGAGGKLRPLPDPTASARTRHRWQMRRVQGRVLSVLRLMKAAFTFRGGIDYAAWKVERHSGIHIDVTPAMRRRPIISGCKVLWKLLRSGALH